MSYKKIFLFFILAIAILLLYKSKFSADKKLNYTNNNASIDIILDEERSQTMASSDEEKAIAKIDAEHAIKMKEIEEEAEIQNKNTFNCVKKIAKTKNKTNNIGTLIKDSNLRKNAYVGDWFLDRNASEPAQNSLTKSSEKFLFALAKAKLLYGYDNNNFKQDDNAAIVLLQELSKIDAKNSAPLSYLCILLDRNNRTKEFSVCIEQLKNTDYFNSYLQEIAKNYISNANDIIELTAVFSISVTTPIIDYNTLTELIIKNKLLNISNQLVVDTLKKENNNEGFDFSLLEYMIGSTTYVKITNDKKRYPHRHDIAAEKKLNSFYSQLQNLMNICYEKGLDQIFYNIKDKYK